MPAAGIHNSSVQFAVKQGCADEVAGGVGVSLSQRSSECPFSVGVLLGCAGVPCKWICTESPGYEALMQLVIGEQQPGAIRKASANRVQSGTVSGWPCDGE